jgi:tetratricopeptide (TPR) repeat protein
MTAKLKIRLRVWAMFLMLGLPTVVPGQQVQFDANKMQLANQYYRDMDLERASVLYKEIFETSGSQYYFNMYLNCLLGMNDFALAEQETKKQLRRTGNDAELYVQWGYLLKLQNKLDDASDKFGQALKAIQNNKGDYVRLANAFLSRQEYERAGQVYLLGRNKLPDESFHYELASIYLFQRNYELMFGEYLELLKRDEASLGRVQSSMMAAFRMDVDHSLREQFRTALLKRIQQDPEVVPFNRLLIWLFIQEKRFAQALRQSIALDKRNGQEDAQIINLAWIAGGNNGHDEAVNAFDYLIGKGKASEFYGVAYQGKMRLLYRQFEESLKQGRDADGLSRLFEETFGIVGFRLETTPLVIDYAHFLAFNQNKIEEAIKLLEGQMAIGGMTALQRDELKNQLADTYVLKDDLWEAVLLYSQIIDANKNNPLGDDVKLKKAKLGYYMGNLSWAQAQLDVLKASTSKLIANDALELSVFISSNTALDTTEVPVQLFAKADLYTFREQDSLAWATLDSIEAKYPHHSLLDDIYYRKAKTLAKLGEYGQAAEFLRKITETYTYDLLADDALFLLAELYRDKLARQEEAGELYKKILTQYPGSIYVDDARKIYRELRGDVPVDKETPFFDGAEIN